MRENEEEYAFPIYKICYAGLSGAYQVYTAFAEESPGLRRQGSDSKKKTRDIYGQCRTAMDKKDQ